MSGAEPLVQQFQFQFDQFLGLPVCLLCLCPTTKARQISLQEKKNSQRMMMMMMMMMIMMVPE